MESNNELVLKKRERLRSASIPELYAVMEALLPFARLEIDCLAGYVATFPDDPDHATDAMRVQQGLEALDEAARLIGKKSATIRRKQRALQEQNIDG